MLRLKNISKYYHETGSVVKALDSIDLEFANNEFVVITGESGSGKSTLLNVISGLDTYEDGEMFFKDKETAYFSKEEWEDYRKRNIGFIFQNYNLIESYTVLQNVEMAALIKGDDKEKRRKKSRHLIERVGLKGKENQKASTLSGGEKQRVAIARALAKDAPLIIADEPTGNLDKKTGESILDLLKEVAKDKLVLLVSHSFESVKPYATRHVRLFDGEVTLDKELSGKASDTEETVVDESEKLSKVTLAKIALKNIMATPKRSIFTLMISLFIVGVFAMVYGSYVQQAYSIQGFNFSGFANATENRLIITNENLSSFSEDDINRYQNMNNVLAVVPYDISFDTEMFIAQVNGSASRQFFRNGYAQHGSVLNRQSLQEGRAPENLNEVVVSSDDFNVGDELSLAFGYPRFHEEDQTVFYRNFTVVGISQSRTDFSFEFYFHDDYFSDGLTKAYGFIGSGQLSLHYEDDMLSFGAYEIMLSEDIAPGEISMNEYIKNQLGISSVDDQTLSLKFREPFEEFTYEQDIILSNVINNEMFSYKMHPDTLSAFFDDIPPYQMTLIVQDRFAAENVMSALESEDINMLYPAAQSDPFTEVLVIIMSIFMGGMALGVALIMYFIGYISLKNVMTAKRKDYIILRSIGLMKRELNLVTMFEMVMTMAFALTVVLVLLIINAEFVQFLPDYLRYYQTGNYIFMIVVLLLLSILLAFRFNKRLFDISVISAFKEQ